MQLRSFRAKGNGRFRATVDSKHSLPVAPNLLDRQSDAAETDRVWVTASTL